MFITEFLDLPPLTGAAGTVQLPGSKSISNRALLLAALAQGRTALHGLLDSDDTQVMLTALRQLGCAVQRQGSSTVVEGLGGQLSVRHASLFMGNAGTAIRPLSAALALLGGEFELSGVPRMHERPIGDLVDALRQLGCTIGYLGQDGFPPLRIGAPTGQPPVLQLQQPIRVRGDVSSQFLTALLMALPLVAKQAITIEVVGELISKPYIEITLNLLRRFGISVQRPLGADNWQRFVIPAGAQYRSPGELQVEADASSASYFIALGAFPASASKPQGIKIEGVGLDSIQGDIRFVEAAQQMGIQVQGGTGWLQVTPGEWPLKAIDLDCNHLPDAAMTLATLALYADGPSTLRNIASWRVKETDRIAAMACELRKLGAQVDEGADFLHITPPVQWTAASIHTYDDHRMAMCFALAAFNPVGLPVRIEDPKCVGKTFPDFFETLFSVVQTPRVPVICIDGPTASGKGTLASGLAQRLGYDHLDSGALYRVAALAALRAGLALTPTNEAAIAELTGQLVLSFKGDQVWLDNENISEAIRTEAAGMNASAVSVLPQVRTALVDLQHRFARLPGLVADGRDMGTVIFPQARLKVYLTASADLRAQRRHKQLISKGISSILIDLCADLAARDARDSSRNTAPLKPAQDALLLDNSGLTIEESINQVLAWWQSKQPFKPTA
ncbi:MAG: bifunctional 3-phosphoshikimate 1-carboxyvinyltransferase/cytidylate kinase [Burkholderiales bacterium]